MANLPADLRVDPERLKKDHEGTGIFVRAQFPPTGKWGSYDIYDLTRESLIQWLRSQGQHNRLAESCVLILLGHCALTEEDAPTITEPPGGWRPGYFVCYAHQYSGMGRCPHCSPADVGDKHG